ncbi:MAG: site-2 protease family protein [Treponema sp.]|nr:site-2 protease family protein [Treponema sp.]
MKWIYGLICLGISVFFHELGHFLFAKFFGVEVLSFSIGYGPILLHRTIKGTDYRISLLPLGGYCGMKGEKDFIKSLEENKKTIEADSSSLYGIHPIKRALIGFAGPLFNVVFAFLSFFVVALIGYAYFTYQNKIRLANEVYPEMHSVAKEAGLLTGDVITRINENTIEDFSDIIENVAPNAERELNFIVDRNGESLSFTIVPELDKESGIGKIGITAFSTEPIKKEAKRYSFFSAIWQGIVQTGKTISLTIRGIFMLFRGIDFKNALSGPARITSMLGETVQEGFKSGARQGFASILDFLAFINISFCIMNLLPIPILDGGLILFAIIECITRRQIHPKVQYYVQYVGLAILACFFIIGLTSDINYFKSLRK